MGNSSFGGPGGVEPLARPEEGSPGACPPTAGLPATSPAPPGGISRVKPQLEELNHQGGKKDPLPIFCRRCGNAGTVPPPPEPPPPAAPARASVTATEPARERHRPVGHRGFATTPGQSWTRGPPRRGPTGRQKVMQPFRKAAALGGGGNWR